jgi:hypothetical protein
MDRRIARIFQQLRLRRSRRRCPCGGVRSDAHWRWNSPAGVSQAAIYPIGRFNQRGPHACDGADPVPASLYCIAGYSISGMVPPKSFDNQIGLTLSDPVQLAKGLKQRDSGWWRASGGLASRASDRSRHHSGGADTVVAGNSASMTDVRSSVQTGALGPGSNGCHCHRGLVGVL